MNCSTLVPRTPVVGGGGQPHRLKALSSVVGQESFRKRTSPFAPFLRGLRQVDHDRDIVLIVHPTPSHRPEPLPTDIPVPGRLHHFHGGSRLPEGGGPLHDSVSGGTMSGDGDLLQPSHGRYPHSTTNILSQAGRENAYGSKCRTSLSLAIVGRRTTTRAARRGA